MPITNQVTGLVKDASATTASQQDTSLNERKRNSSAAQTQQTQSGNTPAPVQQTQPENTPAAAAPAAPATGSSTQSQSYYDSDNAVLNQPEYYEREIEKLRSNIQQIHELRSLLKGLPSYDAVDKIILSGKKDKVIKYTASYIKKWEQFVQKNPDISSWYKDRLNYDRDKKAIIRHSYGNNADTENMILLQSIVDMSNQGQILPYRAVVYSKIEKYKQDRDMAQFIKQAKGNEIPEDFRNKPVYSFKIGNQIVYGYLDSSQNFRTFKTKEELINNSGTISESQKKKLGKTYDEEVGKIKAVGELESKLDASGLMDKINLETITTYMNFDESEFEKKLIEYKASNAEKPTVQSADVYDAEEKSSVMSGLKDSFDFTREYGFGLVSTASDYLQNGKITFLNDIKSLDSLLEVVGDGGSFSEKDGMLTLMDKTGKITNTVSKESVMNGLKIESGLGITNDIFSAINVGASAVGLLETSEELRHELEISDEGVFSNSTAKRVDASNTLVNDIGLGSLSFLSSATANVSKTVASAGAMSFNTLSGILSVTGNVTGGLNIASGVLNTGKGLYDSFKAGNDMHEANKADTKLNQFAAEQVAGNKRFLHRVRTDAQQRVAGGVLNTLTGAIDIAGGIISFFPAAQVAGTVLSLANMALKLIGKFVISKYFKSKHKNQAWADILGFSGIKEYKAFEDKVGKENFRRVLRRKTGVTTRQSYADALNITDAIDIFTMAKLHSGKTDDTASTDEKIIQTTLSGVGYSDPKKYKNLKLSDVLSKVGAGDDWKSTLKASITDKKSREKSEDIA